jgi:hypothetical protein
VQERGYLAEPSGLRLIVQFAELPLRAFRAKERGLRRLVVGEVSLPALFVRRYQARRLRVNEARTVAGVWAMREQVRHCVTRAADERHRRPEEH